MGYRLQFIFESFQPNRSPDREYLPVRIPTERRDALLRAASKRESTSATPNYHDIDALTEIILLQCEAGDFFSAEEKVFEYFSRNINRCLSDVHVLRQFLDLFFIIQRMDIVSEFIRVHYSAPFEFKISLEENGPGIGRLRWNIDQAGNQTFIFDAVILGLPRPTSLFHYEFPLFMNYIKSGKARPGVLIHNHWDMGLSPGLAYSDSRPEYFLVPDYVFVSTNGYEYARTHFRDNPVDWQDRQPVAFWRGSTTGISVPGEWRSLERIKLCEIARQNNYPEFFDVGISDIVQIDRPEEVAQIQESGFVLGRVPWEQWNQYKYLIDIDGNSSPWSNLFQRLLTGSPVLKVESSRNLRQWYYDDLVPWYNYVPVVSSMADLIDKVLWLRANDSAAQKIGENGRALAEKLTYAREMSRSVATISSAFEYFNRDSQIIEEIASEANVSSANLGVRSREEEIQQIATVFKSNGFDLIQYFDQNPDLKQLGNVAGIVDHLISHGFREGRKVPVGSPSALRKALAELNLSTELAAVVSASAQNFKQSMAANIADYKRNHSTLKLEIGAGPVLRKGWLSTDLEARDVEEGSYVMSLDATKTFPFDSNVFDYIYSEHMIEHISFQDGQNMLGEAWRVLKPGGTIRIATPAIEMLLRVMSPNRTELEEKYFFQSVKASIPDAPAITNAFFLNNFMRNWGHTFLYDHETLKLALDLAGFKDVIECRFQESRHPSLCNLEHSERMPPGFLELETMIYEGTKLV